MPLMLAPPPRISVPADSTETPLATPPLFNCSVAPLKTVALTTSKSLPFNNYERDSAFLSAGARLLVGRRRERLERSPVHRLPRYWFRGRHCQLHAECIASHDERRADGVKRWRGSGGEINLVGNYTSAHFQITSGASGSVEITDPRAGEQPPGGTLELAGIPSANIALLANYMAASFVTAAGIAGGTVITQEAQAAIQQPLLTHPHT